MNLWTFVAALSLFTAAAQAEPHCGTTPEQALAVSKVATEAASKTACMLAALELLAAKVEGMRTGTVEFKEIRAENFKKKAAPR